MQTQLSVKCHEHVDLQCMDHKPHSKTLARFIHALTIPRTAAQHKIRVAETLNDVQTSPIPASSREVL